MAGAILTLFNSMVAAPALVGVTQLFGEENLVAQGEPPRVVYVPTDTAFGTPGARGGNYVGDGLNSPRLLWKGLETIEVHLWAASATPTAQPQDHADACEALRQTVLQALQSQRFTGFTHRPVRGRWMRAEGELARRGRGYVIYVEVVVAVTDVADAEAAVTSVPLTPVVVPYGGQ